MLIVVCSFSSDSMHSVLHIVLQQLAGPSLSGPSVLQLCPDHAPAQVLWEAAILNICQALISRVALFWGGLH